MIIENRFTCLTAQSKVNFNGRNPFVNNVITESKAEVKAKVEIHFTFVCITCKLVDVYTSCRLPVVFHIVALWCVKSLHVYPQTSELNM